MSQEGKNLQEKIPVSRRNDPSDVLTKARLEKRIIFIPLYPNTGLQLVALQLKLELYRRLTSKTASLWYTYFPWSSLYVLLAPWPLISIHYIRWSLEIKIRSDMLSNCWFRNKLRVSNVFTAKPEYPDARQSGKEFHSAWSKHVDRSICWLLSTGQLIIL